MHIDNQNDPLRHHILPQVYLRGFQDQKGVLWACNLKTPYKAKIRKTSANGVCYQPNYFKIPNPEIKGNELIVEKFINHSFENDIPKYFGLLNSTNKVLSLDQKYRIAEIILHLKIRNTFVRDTIFDPKLLTSILREIADSFKSNPDVETITAAHSIGESVDSYMDMVEPYVLDKTLQEGGAVSHNEFILNQFNGRSEFKNATLWKIIQGKWTVYTYKSGDKFLVSDNPGVSVINKRCYHLAFDGKFEFIFPINSKQILCITRSKFSDLDALTSLSHGTLDEYEFNKINSATAANANKEVFAENESIIEKTRDNVLHEKFFKF